nr:MAG TPA: putative endonuclease [Caudoviricetes sp.]
MNQEEKTHWTQDKILLYVKACMSATGLTRMPSRSELSEYYGNDKLTNAIRRFPGGYYKIAEILNVEMKESETQFGKYGEDLATKLLEEHGFAVERMSTRYAYDLYVNGSVKVDVKTARLSKTSGTAFYYSFNLEKRFPTCDIYFLIARNEDGESIYIVPASINQTQIGIGEKKTKYIKYQDRYDIIADMSKAFASAKS